VRRLACHEDAVSHRSISGSLRMNDLKTEDNSKIVRPQIIRKIALWWQSELDRAALVGETRKLPPQEEVMLRFQCSEEEALRGVGLGEHRHFSGTE
jgi:hypothetical protein